AFLILWGCASGMGKRLFFRREKWFEAIFVYRFHKRFMWRDDAFFEQRPNCVVHELHTLSPSGNDHILELLRRAFTNDRGDGSVRDQNFIYRDSARPIRSF